MSDLKEFEIAKLEMKSGDTLVLRSKLSMPYEDYLKAKSDLQKIVPQGCNVLILNSENFNLEVIKA